MAKKDISQAIELIKNSKYLTALTGAGISTLSGLADFRGEPNPIWDKYPQEKVFNADYFREDPGMFYDFLREITSHEPKPNISHLALKKLEDSGILKAVITQNIDGLHQAAGSKRVYELHGSVYNNSCVRCAKIYDYKIYMEKIRGEKVPHCVCKGVIRPGVVFFGEQLPEEDFKLAVYSAQKSDCMIVAGTSLAVQPAAYMPRYTLDNGGKIILVNKGNTYLDERADFIFDDIGDFFEELEEGI
jgi:NAD-dependent deacetylase